MRVMTTAALAALLFAGPLATGTWAAASAQEKAEPPKEETAETPPPKRFSLDRSGTFNGSRIDYQVVAGETYLKNDKDEDAASIFSIAYLKKDVKDASRRPVAFLFNGGPGSASLWLHMGMFGPRVVQVPSDAGNAGAAPYPLVDNAHSILDVTDIVFIDPVGTGYSRVLPKGDEKDYYGVMEDARSVAAFIRQWLSENNRWNSPKYVGGESYGAVRTGALAKVLADWSNPVTLNGLLIISGAVDMAALDFRPGNDTAYWSFLPSYAATAFYHGKVSAQDKALGLEAFIDQARAFALDRYAPALLKGNRLPAEERKALVQEVARFTGLSPDYVERTNLRIGGQRFMKELLRDRGQALGRFDSRYAGDDYDDAGETPDQDPSGYGVFGAYAVAINAYLGGELGVQMGREYSVLSSKWSKWNWKTEEHGRQGALNVAPWIGEAMRQNSALRTFVAGGYYDLATPFFAKENAFASNGVPSERIVWGYYPAGHMMYVHTPSLETLAQDVRDFITAGQPAD